MTQINQLENAPNISTSDSLVIFSQENGDARKISVGNFVNTLSRLFKQKTDRISQIYSPSFDSPVLIAINNSDNQWLIVLPSLTLTFASMRLPDSLACVDKQEILITSSVAISVMNVLGNGNLITQNAPPAASIAFGMTANSSVLLRFNANNSTWYRLN